MVKLGARKEHVAHFTLSRCKIYYGSIHVLHRACDEGKLKANYKCNKESGTMTRSMRHWNPSVLTVKSIVLSAYLLMIITSSFTSMSFFDSLRASRKIFWNALNNVRANIGIFRTHRYSENSFDNRSLQYHSLISLSSIYDPFKVSINWLCGTI